MIEPQDCPCGRRDKTGRALPYAQCCGRYLPAFDRTPAPDAEALMRSRYSAFVLERADYLLATWHPSQRPAELSERGWTLSSEECWRIFVGKAVKDERALIEQHTGQPLTEDWLAGFRERRNAALQEELMAVAHVHEAVHAVHARKIVIDAPGT